MPEVKTGTLLRLKCETLIFFSSQRLDDSDILPTGSVAWVKKLSDDETEVDELLHPDGRISPGWGEITDEQLFAVWEVVTGDET